jgi:hypothetical protein
MSTLIYNSICIQPVSERHRKKHEDFNSGQFMLSMCGRHHILDTCHGAIQWWSIWCDCGTVQLRKMQKNAVILSENFGNLTRLIIRENFDDLGNLVTAVVNSLI